MAGNAQQPRRKRNRRRKVKKNSGISPPVKAPVAKSVRTKNVGPSFKQTREGCTITHREYITDITSSSAAFLISVFNINSGLVSSFPWLAQVASRFESYTFERLNYIYEPMVPTSTPGSLMMAIDFDASDSAPANKVTLMSYAGASRASVFDSVRMQSTNIDRKKMVHERYVRSSAILGNQDIKTYDVGNLYIATIGTPNAVTTILGELYVEYTIRLRTPQIQTSPNLNLSGRRAAQQGSISFGSDGKITEHLAEITGEGNQPVLQAIPGNSWINIDPRIKRCIMTVGTTPSVNWTNAFSSAFTNMQTNSISGALRQLVGNGASLALQQQLYLVSTPASFPLVSSVANTPRPIVEQFIIEEADSETYLANQTAWGTMVNSIVVGIRDGLGASTTKFTMKYSIIPLDTGTWPKIATPWQNIINANTAFSTTTLVDTLTARPLEWPTILNALIAKKNIMGDGQVFTFNNKLDLTPTVPK